MCITTSFAIPQLFHAETLLFEGGGVTVLASSGGASALCPVCRHISRRPHSFYTRTLADLPWGGVPVRLPVRGRKFFCENPRVLPQGVRRATK